MHGIVHLIPVGHIWNKSSKYVREHTEKWGSRQKSGEASLLSSGWIFQIVIESHQIISLVLPNHFPTHTNGKHPKLLMKIVHQTYAVHSHEVNSFYANKVSILSHHFLSVFPTLGAGKEIPGSLPHYYLRDNYIFVCIRKISD